MPSNSATSIEKSHFAVIVEEDGVEVGFRQPFCEFGGIEHIIGRFEGAEHVSCGLFVLFREVPAFLGYVKCGLLASLGERIIRGRDPARLREQHLLFVVAVVVSPALPREVFEAIIL